MITFQDSPIGETIQEQKETIQRMVQEGLAQMRAGIPIVTCESINKNLFEVHCITENVPEIIEQGPVLLSTLLPSDVSITSYSVTKTSFAIASLPGRFFLYLDIRASSQGKASQTSLSEHCALIRKQITLALMLPSHGQQLISAQAASFEIYPPILKQELAKWLTRYTYALALKNRHLYDRQACSLNTYEDRGESQITVSSVIPSATATYQEFLRLLLAADDEFKRIRTPQHLMKLVRSQLWLKQHHSPHKSPHRVKTRLFFRIFRSQLHFPFGVKNVISLVVSLRSLSTYERFDHRHIALACKRCSPTLEAVPQSFVVYRYSDEPTIALYLELEKQDGSSPSQEDFSVLKQELERELNVSIEQLMSRIDIPHNEEDLLRNLLLLSQQCRTVKSTPQVIIQFHEQGDSTLDFQVTLVRIVKKGDEDPPSIVSNPTSSVRCMSVRSSIIDTMRTTYVKQSLTVLMQCSKESFLRSDRSINFLQARGAIVQALETTFGKIRDLNGGLIYQQHQLLKSILALLGEDERKELTIIEDLFHSLSPIIMKNILGPEHMVTVFRQLTSLRETIKSLSNQKILVEEYSKETFIGFVCPQGFTKEEIFQGQLHFQMAENELALCTASYEEYRICFVVCLCPEAQQRKNFTEWLQDRIEEWSRARKNQCLKISLPRPTLMLDPRIGTDRTSGTVIKMLYEGLMRLDQSGNPTPAIAEEVLISNDGRTYTFHLRPTCWTNGQPVTAHDFEYAWRKILEPSFQTVFDYLLHPIRNARLVKSGKEPPESLGIRSLNDRILIIELEKPFPQFLELCCLWIYSPLCKDLDRTRPGWAYYGDHSYVCNGPFKLKKWGRRGDIQVIKNDRYWDKERVQIEEIDISIIEDPMVALSLFEQGELDWLGEPLSETPLCLFKNERPDLHIQPMSSVQWFAINTQHPPFCSSKVRRALSLALDRSAIIKEILHGDERISHSILPASLSLLDPNQPLECNVEKARDLFSEGLTDQNLSSSSLKPIKILVYDQDPHKSIARVVARSWERAFHVPFVIEVVRWHEFFERYGRSSHDILANVWYSWYKDPMYTLGILRSSSNSINFSRWSHDQLNTLLDRAEASHHKRQRESLLRDAEQLVMEEMPIIPLFDHSSRFLKNEAVDNIYISHLGNIDFKFASLTRLQSLSPRVPRPLTDEVHFYLQSEPASLDPRIGGDHRNQILIRELYEGLMRIGKGGTLEPALAERVTVSEDRRVYTFHLRPSHWSNGMPLVAEDFVWTIKSAVCPSFSSSYAFAFFSIRNAKKAHHGECSLNDIGVRAIDPLTLEITLKKPVFYFLELTANPIYSPVCRAIAEANPRWSLEVFPKYVSNGPFVLKAHAPKSHILLEKNPYYWNPDGAKSERLSFSIIKDSQKAFQLFSSGQLDWYGDPFGTMSPETFSSLKRTDSITTQRSGSTLWLECRTDHPHLRSKFIRQALASAINRQELCDAFPQEGEQPALTILEKSLSSLDTDPIEDNRPDLANDLFQKGLSELGLTKDTCHPIIITHWSEPKMKGLVKLIQKQLQTVLGIRVETSLLDWTTYLKRLSTGEFQIILGCWFTWFQDPIYTLQHVKDRKNGFNTTHFEHPEYIRLLDLSDAAKDHNERRSYLRQAELFVMDEMPIIPLLYRTINYAKQPYLTNECLSPIGLPELKWIEKTQPGSIP